MTPPLTLTLGHLYPDQLNLYGDRGNILVLRRRCQQRGIELRVVGLGIGDALAPDEYDMLFIGGGQDKEEIPVAQDLHDIKGIGLWAAIEDDMPVLAVCGVGFENHGGRTYLGTARPLGKVLKGHGNNSEDTTEGAIYRNTYGTYMHGSLLPKNPHFADHLIGLALRRKYDIWATPDTETTGERTNGTTSTDDDTLALLTPLDDTLEWEAHTSLLEKLGLHSQAIATWQAHNTSKVS